MSKDNPAFVPDISTDSSDIKFSVTPTPETKPQKTDNSCCSPRCRTVFLVFLSFIAVSYAIAITIVLIHEVYFSDEGEHGIQQKQFTAYEVLANTARGYIDVRKGAHMFWWLWYAIPKHTYKEKPLILWIQGGPGESGVGIGGFMEIGPYDTDLKYKKGNWAVHANLLIVDSPVGVGYSYVDNESLNTKNTEEIIADLMSFLKIFFNKHPEFKTIPFHIFGESYGGRIAPLLAKQLHKEIIGGKMECLLKGIVLGGPAVDIMIGPVATWAQYLYTLSIIEESKKDEYEREYQKLMVTYQTKNYTAISEEFQKLSQIPYGTGIDMYNVLTWNTIEELFGPVTKLMNGEMKKAVEIVPENLVWTDMNTTVMANEFDNVFIPVVDTVDFLLTNTSCRVTIYNGQLDVVVNTIGTEKWLKKLTWSGMETYYNQTRTTLRIKPKSKPIGFKKTYDKFTFYWILKSGHQVPHDAPLAGEYMLIDILKNT